MSLRVLGYGFIQLGFLLFFASVSHAKSWDSIAIFGDSLATGAATHPNLEYDSNALLDVFLGKTNLDPEGHPSLNAFLFENKGSRETSLPSPTLLWPSPSEFRNGPAWLFKYFVNGISSVYLNTEAYSWGYLLGRKSGVEPQNIFIAAENGASMQSFSDQIQRYFSHSLNLPQVVVVNFSGNDLCAANFELMEMQLRSFQALLTEGLNQLISQGNPHPEGTQIYVPGFIHIGQLFTDNEILEKQVTAFNQQTTCSALRKQMYQAPEGYKYNLSANPVSGFASYLPPNPVLMCPTLFANQSEEKHTIIANKVREIRKFQQAAVADVRAKLASEPALKDKKISIEYLSQQEDVAFLGKDIAVDCFHLSVDGQVKLASTLFDEIKQKGDQP